METRGKCKSFEHKDIPDPNHTTQPFGTYGGSTYYDNSACPIRPLSQARINGDQGMHESSHSLFLWNVITDRCPSTNGMGAIYAFEVYT